MNDMQVHVITEWDLENDSVGYSVHLSETAALADLAETEKTASAHGGSASLRSFDVDEVPDSLGLDWYDRMRVEMFRAMRDMLGSGYVQHYYEDAAADFVSVAEGYVRMALGEK